MKTLRFERLDEGHISQILGIESQVNSAPWSAKSFQNELTHSHGYFLVALVNGKVVGYGGFWMVIDEAHITTIAISPDHQRKGIGRKLMMELLTQAKRAGMVCSTLEVRASNEAAIKLYEDLGYQIAALRKAYYPDNKEDASVMWLHHLDKWEPPAN